ncbi:unnamed protein product [Ceratitis capitata]|uniref:(Mediterranean fruit fly) hypothetical protein n=1 Tax=Ceratitis capitata TaxID=7213 RepID=A0A811US00_CERCA|nr:unnamed protein product [Ceratitis capitata]
MHIKVEEKLVTSREFQPIRHRMTTTIQPADISKLYDKETPKKGKKEKQIEVKEHFELNQIEWEESTVYTMREMRHIKAPTTTSRVKNNGSYNKSNQYSRIYKQTTLVLMDKVRT